jgi:nucleoside-diphosphate-sugar epimerase
MRVFLTGGAGFIGSHLCDALLAQGDTPVILDNLSTGQLSNIAHIQNKVEIHQGDIRDAALVNKLTEQSDLVLHMAAALGVNTILEKTVESVSTNFTGSEVVLQVVPRFVQSALKNEPITIYGDGTQSRVFCHVLDAIDAVLKITKDDKTIGEVFNVGGEGETTIQQLAEKIIANTKSTSGLTFTPYSQAYPTGFEDMQRRVPDITKAKAALNWKPTRNLDQIINDVTASLK